MSSQHQPSPAKRSRGELQRAETVIYTAKDDGLNGGLKPLSSLVSPLLTDMYQITMAYSLWKNKRHEMNASFDLFFRKNPFKGEFTIFAGLEEVIRFLSDFKFKEEQVTHVKKILPEADEEFWNWLRGVDCSKVTVKAIKEGNVVFPRVPLITVEGPMGVCQLLETTLLTLVNFASLVATNASRHVLAAGKNKVILEFGLRRAQGPDGGVSASRYSYVGGCDGTSNVLASQLFGIPVRGTHAHSFVTSFEKPDDFTERKIKTADGKKEADLWEAVVAARKELGFTNTNTSELVSFAAYASTFPRGFLALVDTYDTLNSGVPNFLVVAFALHKLGYPAVGIRLDSGDLAYLSKESRKLFKETAKKIKVDYFEKFQIVASNDLNEETIISLNRQGHEIDTFAVGTNLVTCQAQPALGCVYKLVEIEGAPRIKLSQEANKITLPGKKDAYRLYGSAGHALVDIMIPSSTPEAERPKEGERVLCLHPFEEQKRVYVVPAKVEPLYQVVWNGGVAQEIPRIADVREFCKEALGKMREDHLRSLNPTPYKVSVSAPLYKTIHSLMLESVPIKDLS